MDEVHTLIRNQRYKIKFKYGHEEHCKMSNCLQRLNGTLPDMVILKMIKCEIDWDEENGPLMEKRVTMNEKMQYYVRRY
jgi:hypothetical protein